MDSYAKKVKRFYRSGKWPESWVRDANSKGRISADELAAIISPETVVAEVGRNATKPELLEAADLLGVDAPDGATNAELWAALCEEAGLPC